jgi:hypothetical protein
MLYIYRAGGIFRPPLSVDSLPPDLFRFGIGLCPDGTDQFHTFPTMSNGLFAYA